MRCPPCHSLSLRLHADISYRRTFPSPRTVLVLMLLIHQWTGDRTLVVKRTSATGRSLSWVMIGTGESAPCQSTGTPNPVPISTLQLPKALIVLDPAGPSIPRPRTTLPSQRRSPPAMCPSSQQARPTKRKSYRRCTMTPYKRCLMSITTVPRPHSHAGIALNELWACVC